MSAARRHPALVLAILGTLISGCVVGPDYRGPPLSAPLATKAPTFAQAQDAGAQPPPSRWWIALGDPTLGGLITDALAANPDAAAAAARLRQSRALLRQDQANGLPTTSATAASLRAKGLTSAFSPGAAAAQGAGGSPILDVYTAGVDATWELDLFGGNRRAVEGARAEALAVEADGQALSVSLAAEVADAYVTLREQQTRRDLLDRDIEAQDRSLALTRLRRAGGTVADPDLERLAGDLAGARAQAQAPRAMIEAQMNRLAVLTGREPGALAGRLGASAPPPAPPAVIAVGDPAALLRRRPDVRAAERRLAERNAQIGQRTADLFPKVTLLGDLGFTSNAVANLLTTGSFMYVAAPILQWSPLDFGRTQARIGQARAARDEAEANYRKTVLTALEDAETGLARYGRQRAAALAQADVTQSADRAAALAGRRLEGGTATVIDALAAERVRLRAQIDLVAARAQTTRDYVALQKSLGLGWGSGPDDGREGLPHQGP